MLPRQAALKFHQRNHVSSIIPKAKTPPCRRHFHLEGLALAPVLYGGLFISLWAWKCFMMVTFQNKIIYMPGMPPTSRWEKISDYGKRLGGIAWREERIRASDGTELALCVTDLELGSKGSALPDADFYILYFQGNASSIPPRLPDLSSTLSMLKRQMASEKKNARCTMVCLSYRGYWTSRGRPTEKGIRLDAVAAIEWISRKHKEPYTDAPNKSAPAEIILWGQSIGSGVATNLAAEKRLPENLHLNSLILETPFTSLRAMLEAIYPQKWLPYKYLWPFLRNHLDSWKNLGLIADMYNEETSVPEIFILQAAKDELVPAEISQKIYDRCLDLNLPVRRIAVNGAFHNDAMFKAEGKVAVSRFLAEKIIDS